MQVLGYSERGVINSFFYEMAYHKDSTKLFNHFLKLIQPMIDGVDLLQFEAVKAPKIIIEPSFSDFGDADAVIMFEDENIGKTVLFVEAKVCAEKSWDLSKDVLDKFSKAIHEIDNNGTNLSKNDMPKQFSSNLMTQLYHKFEMICKLDYKVVKNDKARLALSPKFSKDNWERSIGENETVIEIVNEIKSFAKCMNSYYIGIIPSGNGLPINPIPPSFTTAATIDSSFACFQERLGYITWQKIYDNIVKNNMTNTDEVFKLNQAAVIGRTKNQIYNPVIENAPNNP